MGTVWFFFFLMCYLVLFSTKIPHSWRWNWKHGWSILALKTKLPEVCATSKNTSPTDELSVREEKATWTQLRGLCNCKVLRSLTCTYPLHCLVRLVARHQWQLTGDLNREKPPAMLGVEKKTKQWHVDEMAKDNTAVNSATKFMHGGRGRRITGCHYVVTISLFPNTPLSQTAALKTHVKSPYWHHPFSHPIVGDSGYCESWILLRPSCNRRVP